MLVGLSSYPSRTGNPVAPLIVATREQIIAQLVELADGLTPPTIDKALDHLVLTAAQLDQDEIEPWKLRSRRHRLATRPIVQITMNGDESLLFGTWFMARSGHIFTMYLGMGSLPFAEETLSDELREQLAKYGQELNNDFEKEVRTCLRNMGFDAERIKPDKLVGICGEIADDNPGEIDSLFPQAETNTIWVIEAKDTRRRVTPREMKTEMNKFFQGEKSYSRRLRRKVNAVTKHLPDFLRYFGLDTASPWQVQGAFVTRELVPSGFARPVDFPFYTLEIFLEMLDSTCQSQKENR